MNGKELNINIDSNLQDIYNIISGYNENIIDYDVFKSQIQDSTKARDVHNILLRHNRNLIDFSTFYNNISLPTNEKVLGNIVLRQKKREERKTQIPISPRGAMAKAMDEPPDITTERELGRGLVSGVMQTFASAGTAEQYIGSKLGIEWLEKLGREGYEYWAEQGKKLEIPEELSGKLIDNPALLGKSAWWAYNLGQMTPSFLAALIPAVGTAKYINVLGKNLNWTAETIPRLAKLAPAIAGGLTGGVLEGTNTYQEILAKGGSPEEAETAMELMTMAAGALNALSLGKIMQKLPEGMRGKLLQYLSSGATEGITEFLEEPTEGFIKLGLGRADLDEVWEQTKAGINVIPIAGVMGIGGSIAVGASTEVAKPEEPAKPVPEEISKVVEEKPTEVKAEAKPIAKPVEGISIKEKADFMKKKFEVSSKLAEKMLSEPFIEALKTRDFQGMKNIDKASMMMHKKIVDAKTIEELKNYEKLVDEFMAEKPPELPKKLPKVAPVEVKPVVEEIIKKVRKKPVAETEQRKRLEAMRELRKRNIEFDSYDSLEKLKLKLAKPAPAKVEGYKEWERKFIEISTKTFKAEKQGELSKEEFKLLNKDWKEFSKARGYTEKEITDFEKMINLEKEGREKFRLTTDETATIQYQIQKQLGLVGKAEKVAEKPKEQKFKMGDIVEYKGEQWEVGFVNKIEWKGTLRLQKSGKADAKYINRVSPENVKLVKQKPTVVKNLKDATKEAAKGVNELIKNLPAGMSIRDINKDEATYQNAKVHFDRGWEHSKAAGKNIREYVLDLIITVGIRYKPLIDRWERETEGVKEGAVEEKVEDIPKIDERADIANIFDKWIANKDEQIQSAKSEALRLQDEIKESIGSKKYDKEAKNVDKAIQLYIDIKGKSGQIKKFEKLLTDEQKELLNLSQNLTEEQINIANKIIERNTAFGKYAKSKGVIKNVLDNYTMRLWKTEPEGKQKASIGRKFGTITSRAKHRILESILHGWALGKELKVKTATNALSAMQEEIAKVVEDRNLIQQARKLDLIDFHQREDNWVKVEHPNFKWWHWIGKVDVKPIINRIRKLQTISEKIKSSGRRKQTSAPLQKAELIVKESLINRGMEEGEANAYIHKIKGGQAEEVITEIKEIIVKESEIEQIKALSIQSLKRKDIFIDDSGNVMRRGEMYATPIFGKRLNKILEISKIRGIWGIEAITRFNAEIKNTILMTSFFHHQAFLRSYLFGARTGLKYLNPVKAMRAGLKSAKEFTPEVRELVRGGLTTGLRQDFDEIGWSESQTKFGKLIDKVPGGKIVKDKLLKIRDTQVRFLFNVMGPGLKVQAALLEYRHMLKKYDNKITSGEMTREEIAKMSAKLINDDFGGLHHARLGRGQTEQHLLRLFLLAPDWTESNVRSMVKMLVQKNDVTGKIEIATGAEGTMYRAFWGRIALRALTGTILFNVLMSAIDDKGFWERYKSAWKSGRMRWLDVDVTPLYRALGGDSESRKYFSLLGHFRDPLKFILHPFRSLKHKGSVISRFFLDAITGRDWAGRKFTTLSELIGIDDKGVYKTTRKGKYEKGDPKGGKLKGRLVEKFSFGSTDPITYDRIPSYLLAMARSSMPIQIQSMLSYLSGEMDAFDALTRGLGFMTARTFEKKEEKPKTSKSGLFKPEK